MKMSKEEVSDREIEKVSLKLSKSLFLVAGFSSFSVSLFNPFLNFYAVFIGASFTELGWLTSAKNLFLNVFQLFWGYLSDLKGKRIFLGVGYLFTGLLVLTVCWVNSSLVLIGLVTLLYFLYSMTLPSWTSLLGDYSEESTRGKVLGIVGFVSQFASVTAYLVVVTLTFNSKLSNEFLIKIPFILAGFTSLTASFFVLPLKEKRNNQIRKIAESFTGSFKVGNYRRFLYLSSFNAFSMSLVWPIFSYLTVLLTNNTVWEMALIWGAWSISNSLGQRFLGKLIDLYGRKPFLIISKFSLFVVPLGYILSNLSSSWVELFVVMLTAGVFMSLSIVSETAYILDCAEEGERASFTAMFNFLTGIFSFTGSMVGGFLTDLFKFSLTTSTSLNLVLLVSLVLRVVSGLSYKTLKEVHVPIRQQSSFSS